MPNGPYQLAFTAGSISWKSGSNVSDFYGVQATAATITGTLPSTLPAPAPAPGLSVVFDTSQMVGGQLTPVSATGTGFDSGVTLQFSNSGACANYACSIPAGDIISRA